VAILCVAIQVVPALRHLAYWKGLPENYFETAVLALALTPIILTGGIDLSVGSVTVFAAMIAGVLLRDAHWPTAAALTAALAAGLLAGLANGTLVAVGVVPLVATLATRELFRGLASTISGGDRVSQLPAAVGSLWNTTVLGQPFALVLFAGLALVAYAIIHHSWMGRMIFAVGDKEVAARFAGVPVKRLKLGLYVASGLLAGLCGAAYVAHHRSASADVHKSLDLTAIACVVLGGVRVTGGSGHVSGTLLGIVTVVAVLEFLTDAWPEGRDVALGALLIAVAVSNEAGRRTAARRMQST
jgi:rhamnose transport system permease protein